MRGKVAHPTHKSVSCRRAGTVHRTEVGVPTVEGLTAAV